MGQKKKNGPLPNAIKPNQQSAFWTVNNNGDTTIHKHLQGHQITEISGSVIMVHYLDDLDFRYAHQLDFRVQR